MSRNGFVIDMLVIDIRIFTNDLHECCSGVLIATAFSGLTLSFYTELQ